MTNEDISDLIDDADGERINRFGESIPKDKSNKLRNTLSTINKEPKDLQIKINDEDEISILLDYGGWRYL